MTSLAFAGVPWHRTQIAYRKKGRAAPSPNSVIVAQWARKRVRPHTSLVERACEKQSSNGEAIVPVREGKTGSLHIARVLRGGWALLKSRLFMSKGQRKRLLLQLVLFGLAVMVTSTYHHVLVNPAAMSAYWLPFGDGQLSLADVAGMALFYLALEPVSVLLILVLKVLRLVDQELEFNAAFAEVMYPLRSLGWVFCVLVAYDLMKWMNSSRGGTVSILATLSPTTMRRLAIVVLCTITLDWIKGVYFEFCVNTDKATTRENKMRKRDERGEYVLLSKGLSVAMVLAALCSAAAIIGVPVKALTTFGGISTLAVTFALREVLKDLYAGIMISIFKPFLEHDSILIPGFESKGRIQVEKIGWMHTIGRMWDSNEVVVPNSQLYGSKVINVSLRHAGYFSETVHVRYSDLSRVQALLDEIETLLASDARVNSTEYKPMVETEQLTSSGIVLRFSAWLHAKTHRDVAPVSSALLIAIAQRISASGCDFSFPRIMLETTSSTGSSSGRSPSSPTNFAFGDRQDKSSRRASDVNSPRQSFPWD